MTYNVSNMVEALDQAKALITSDRQKDYGPPGPCFDHIASYWTVYLSKRFNQELTITGRDVAKLMGLFKTARDDMGEEKPDNPIDEIGYIAIRTIFMKPFTNAGE